MPILEPEPPDANELPHIVSYDLESPPQGTGRKQQIIGSYGHTLAIQARLYVSPVQMMPACHRGKRLQLEAQTTKTHAGDQAFSWTGIDRAGRAPV